MTETGSQSPNISSSWTGLTALHDRKEKSPQFTSTETISPIISTDASGDASPATDNLQTHTPSPSTTSQQQHESTRPAHINGTLQHMAERYRIPSILPKPPSFKERTPSSSSSTPSAQPLHADRSQQNLIANYLAMLATKPSTPVVQTHELDRQSMEDAVKSMLGQGMFSLQSMHPMTLADLVNHCHPSSPSLSPPLDTDASTASSYSQSTPDAVTSQLSVEFPALPQYNPGNFVQPRQQYLTSPYNNAVGDEFSNNTSPFLSDTASPNVEFATSPFMAEPTSPFSAFIPYDTSPPMDTPLLTFDDEEEEFNTGPIEDSPYQAEMHTPIMEAYDNASMDLYTSHVGGVVQSALFNDGATQMYEDIQPISIGQKNHLLSKVKQETMTPDRPPLVALPSAFRSTTTTVPSPLSSTKPLTKRAPSTAPVHTGIRKNSSPSTLIPLDAPTQKRRYITPSVTSRKEYPEHFARKRARLISHDEDELDEPLEPLPINATEKEAIEHKRRQNTIAARKSRKRKLEYLRGLEDDKACLQDEVQMWKTRAETLAALCKAHGVPGVDAIMSPGAQR